MLRQQFFHQIREVTCRDHRAPARQRLVALQALEVAKPLHQPGRIGDGVVVVAQQEVDTGAERRFDAAGDAIYLWSATELDKFNPVVSAPVLG